jgi:hypothetical protein
MVLMDLKNTVVISNGVNGLKKYSGHHNRQFTGLIRIQDTTKNVPKIMRINDLGRNIHKSVGEVQLQM